MAATDMRTSSLAQGTRQQKEAASVFLSAGVRHFASKDQVDRNCVREIDKSPTIYASNIWVTTCKTSTETSQSSHYELFIVLICIISVLAANIVSLFVILYDALP